MNNRMTDLNRQGFMNIKTKAENRPLYFEGVRIDKESKNLYKLTYGAESWQISGTMAKVKKFIKTEIVR